MCREVRHASGSQLRPHGSPTMRCTMKNLLGLLLLSLIALGCRLPEEREALRPLPEKNNSLAYADLFHRAKVQANAALDAFHTDNWLELEQTAQVLEQTAAY